ncbi:MAG: MurR/RpiR family transcriptional regulator [Desulfobacterales bacterium]|jgi:DNA-binding MurR/RpiR family transcriptional regulator|nr:MurR/RpiR family transcriptional regulator [Desulfobacterales bacterium]
MVKHNIFQIIRDRYDGLSHTYQHIAEFIMNNMETAIFASLGELSKRTGVSDATLIRFARELGFKGFQDMREAMAAYIRGVIYPSHKKQSAFDQKEIPVLEKVWNMDIEFINQTMEGIDREWFKSAIDVIASAERIYAMGWGTSSFLAEFLCFQLDRLGYNAVALVRERRPLIERMLYLKRGDVLIVFDFQLYIHEVVEAVEYLRTHVEGVKVITITSDATAQIVQYADYSFFCVFWAVVGRSEALMGSLSAPMSLINAICEAVIAKAPDKAKESLEKIEKDVMNNPARFYPYSRRTVKMREKEGP